MAETYHVVDIETTGADPWDADLICVGITSSPDGGVVLPPDEGRAAVRDLLISDAIVVAHTNYDLRWMMLDLGISELPEGMQYRDTKVMAFQLDATQLFALDILSQKYLGYTPPKYIKQIKGQIMWVHPDNDGPMPIQDAPWQQMHDYNLSDIRTTARLYEELRERMQNQKWWELFLEEEAPFSKLLVEMEVIGLPLDVEECQELCTKVVSERDALAIELVEETEVLDFNLKSGDQVAAYLFDEVPVFKIRQPIPSPKTLPKEPYGTGEFVTDADGSVRELMGDKRWDAVAQMYPQIKVEKVGNVYVYGTQTVEGRGLEATKQRKNSKDMREDTTMSRPPVDAESLSILHGGDGWVTKYLKWKSLHTLANNFLEVWIERSHNGRLHGRFDQARAETGRVVSRDPNLQSVPAVGISVRGLFREPMFVGDYSGLDARVAAHFSEDPVLLEIFREGKDLYGVLAANAWGGPADKTNPRRSLMKILYLSLQYSAGPKSIADKMRAAGMFEEARFAKKLLQDLEETVPRLFAWKDECLSEAKHRGFITTLAGRRRMMPNLDSPIWKIKAREERKVVASTVQGSSADIVRRCMLRVREQVSHDEARMLLQVHDEILLKRGPAWNDESMEKLKHMFETAHDFVLNIPMKFDCAIANSWEDKDAQGARSYRTMVVQKGA